MDSSFGSSESPHKLNNEEIQHLLNKISSDEQKELTDALRSCTSEVTMTRGLPVTAAVLGSVYFARTRLPAKFHFGPKGWPMYAILGIGSLTVTNMFSMNMCRDRIQPMIDGLWRKYQNQSQTSYASIREQHRQGAGMVPAPVPTSSSSYDPYSTPPPVASRGSHVYGSMLPAGGSSSFDLTQDSSPPKSTRSLPPPSPYVYDQPSYMSGTPSGNTGATNGGPEFS